MKYLALKFTPTVCAVMCFIAIIFSNFTSAQKLVFSKDTIRVTPKAAKELIEKQKEEKQLEFVLRKTLDTLNTALSEGKEIAKESVKITEDSKALINKLTNTQNVIIKTLNIVEGSKSNVMGSFNFNQDTLEIPKANLNIKPVIDSVKTEEHKSIWKRLMFWQ